MRTVLIVVHDYPPICSAGAERPLKFAQHLPDFGYQPVILTTGRYGGLPDDVVQRVYRANDLLHTLFGFVRRSKAAVPQTEQYRVATIANQSFLGRMRDAIMIPDTKLGWMLPAVALGHRLIAERRPALIFSSSPPETAHLIANCLNRLTGIPWVADLRDGWLYEPPNPAVRQPRIRRWLEGRLEHSMVRHASALVAATTPIAEDLQHRYHLEPRRVAVIHNGYERSEYIGLSRQRRPDGLFRLTYTGSLSFSRQNTSPASFFAAVAKIVQANPATPLRVHMIGAISDAEKNAVAALSLTDYITFFPAVSRREAHQHQLDADALLLITAPGQRSIATLKLFDYIGAGVPILALAKGNAAAELVTTYGLGVTAPPDDPDAIAAALDDLMTRQLAGATWPGFAAAQARFERRALTRELAGLFDTILESNERR